VESLEQLKFPTRRGKVEVEEESSAAMDQVSLGNFEDNYKLCDGVGI
jgi:hypothetical protein